MASVGDILRETRKEQKRSIEDIASTTKIRSNILVALENNELDVLPLPYVKSFVKTYARLLEVDDREEIRTFLASSAPKAPPAAAPAAVRSAPGPSAPGPSAAEPSAAPQVEKPFPTQRFPGRSSAYITTIVYAGLGLGILVLVYYFLLYEPAPETASVPPPSSSTPPVEVGDSGSEPSSFSDTAVTDSSALAEMAQQDSLILEARTSARVWISITTDGKRSWQQMLEADNTYRWSADSIFKLSLGNAGGIHFTLNGRPLQALGRAGAIVRDVRITRNGIVSSSSPYNSQASGNRQTQPSRTRSQSRDRASSPPLITPAETKPTRSPSLPPPEKEKPISNEP